MFFADPEKNDDCSKAQCKPDESCVVTYFNKFTDAAGIELGTDYYFCKNKTDQDPMPSSDHVAVEQADDEAEIVYAGENADDQNVSTAPDSGL